MSDELRPCPFCGGNKTETHPNGRMWTGQKYSDPVSVSIRHWCEDSPGQPHRMIERIGRDEASAIEAWNARASLAQTGATPAPDVEALAHRMAWRYKKSFDPAHSDTYTFNRSTLLQFAGALQGAPTAQPAPQWIGAGPEGAVVCRACGRPPESQRAALAQTGAEPVAVVYPPDGTVSPFTVINLGAGRVQMGDSIHDRRLPALWFGKNGQGMGHEEEMNREAREGETLAVVTFANVEGLDVLVDVIQRIRRVSFPDAAPTAQPAPLPAREPVACVTECEACFTPDACQLRGTCDHYAASQLRIAPTAQPAPPDFSLTNEGKTGLRLVRKALSDYPYDDRHYREAVVPALNALDALEAPLPAREPLTSRPRLTDEQLRTMRTVCRNSEAAEYTFWWVLFSRAIEDYYGIAPAAQGDAL